MRRIFPHPVLMFGLALLWLILQQQISAGHIVLGLLIGFGASFITARLDLDGLIVRRPWVLVTLIVVVVIDIARSNAAVAWLAMSPRGPQSAGFMHVPLTTRNRTILAFLAMIITATPGTVWVEFDEETGDLLVHVLDLIDVDEWVDILTNRYERRLIEIFE